MKKIITALMLLVFVSPTAKSDEGWLYHPVDKSIYTLPNAIDIEGENQIVAPYRLGASKFTAYGNMKYYASRDMFGDWWRHNNYISINIDARKQGRYKVVMRYSCDGPNAGSIVKLTYGEQLLRTKIAETGGFHAPLDFLVGEIDLLDKEAELKIQAEEMASRYLWDFFELILVPIE